MVYCSLDSKYSVTFMGQRKEKISFLLKIDFSFGQLLGSFSLLLTSLLLKKQVLKAFKNARLCSYCCSASFWRKKQTVETSPLICGHFLKSGNDAKSHFLHPGVEYYGKKPLELRVGTGFSTLRGCEWCPSESPSSRARLDTTSRLLGGQLTWSLPARMVCGSCFQESSL